MAMVLSTAALGRAARLNLMLCKLCHPEALVLREGLPECSGRRCTREGFRPILASFGGDDPEVIKAQVRRGERGDPSTKGTSGRAARSAGH